MLTTELIVFTLDTFKRMQIEKDNNPKATYNNNRRTLLIREPCNLKPRFNFEDNNIKSAY